LAFWFLDNLTKTPILSAWWYYDIPTATFLEDNDNFGDVKVNTRLKAYEGNFKYEDLTKLLL
jgi:hypothetical protein